MVFSHFLQSTAWQAFQESQGVSTLRLTSNSHHQWSALALHEMGPAHTLRLYSSYGPSFADAKSLDDALTHIELSARTEGDVFVRVEPVGITEDAEEHAHEILQARGYHRVEHVQPEDTLIANLDLSPEEILKNMKGNTRRAYKNAEKHDIHVRTSTNPADVSELTRLMAQVSQRNDVSLRDTEYMTTQAEILLSQESGALYLASTSTSPEGEKIDETVVAASLAYLDSSTAYYAHAGSDYRWRKARPNTVLLAHMMLDAAAAGRTRFDFYGIAPENAPQDHPWYGFTSFKKSFGGQRRTYLGTWEKPIRSVRYFAYNLGRKLIAHK